jgi:hypothetical protein
LTKLSREWGKPEFQYQVLVVTLYFKRFPASLLPSSIPDIPFRAFKPELPDQLLRLGNGYFVSNLATGRFIWEFASVPEQSHEILSSQPPSIDREIISDAAEFTFQQEFCEQTNSIFGGLTLSSPSDFAQVSEVDFSRSSSVFPSIIPHDKPKTVGREPAAFLSSFGFFGPIENYTLYPELNPFPISEPPSYIRVLHIGFSSAEPHSPHFDEFRSGLGLVNIETGDIIYRTYRCEMIFDASTQSALRPVQIVWVDGLGGQEKRMTYGKETFLRIEISERPNGTFQVRTYQRPNQSIGIIEDVHVSKQVLPLFVIAQIRTIVDLFDATKIPPVNPIAEAGRTLRAQAEPNFISRDLPFACEKKLLES